MYSFKEEKVIDFFKRYFYFYCGKLVKTNYPVRILHNNRMERLSCVHVNEETKEILLIANLKLVSHEKRYILLNCLFHEIAHVQNATVAYNTKIEQTEAEYKAEKLGLSYFIKYFPEEYNKYLEWFKNNIHYKQMKREDIVHYLAFKRIKVYKNIFKQQRSQDKNRLTNKLENWKIV